jgi:hypothetical protein
MICTEIDDFLIDQDGPIWIVELSDGTKVYQDEDRPGLEPIAWKRLRDHCYANNVYPVKSWIKFRSHTEPACEGIYGMFYRRGVLASPGDGKNYRRYIMGGIDENLKINTKTWRVPEIIEYDDEREERDIENNEDGIIWNLQSPAVKTYLNSLTISPNSLPNVKQKKNANNSRTNTGTKSRGTKNTDDK